MNWLLAPMLVLSLLATGESHRPFWMRTFHGGATMAAKPSRDVYYIRTGDTLYVRGAISATKDIAQKYYLAAPPDNAHTDFYTAYILAPTAAYTLAGMRDGAKVDASPAVGNTDACPITTNNCGAVMGPHGLSINVYNATGHGKTAADLYSEWTDATHNYIITAIPNANSLELYSVPYTSGSIWMMGPTGFGSDAPGASLTHVRGAADATAITRTSASTTTEKVVTKNNTMSILKDGVTAIADGASGYAAYVDIVEEWDIINPSTLDTTNFGDPWSWTDGDVWLHVKNTHHCTGGTTMTYSEYDWGGTMSIAQVHGVMETGKTAAGYANRYYYIPATKTTSRWGFVNPLNFPVNVADFGTSDSWYMKADTLEVATRLPDRHIVLWGGADESLNYDIGFSIGYEPFLSGASAPRLVRIPTVGGYSYCYLNTNEKIYPNLWGRATTGATMNATADSAMTFYAYRQFFDQSLHARSKYAYWNTAGGYDWVFVDYHATKTNDATVLPERMWGKAVTVIDTLNVYNISATVPATGILVSTTAQDTLGYAVLRLQ